MGRVGIGRSTEPGTERDRSQSYTFYISFAVAPTPRMTTLYLQRQHGERVALSAVQGQQPLESCIRAYNTQQLVIMPAYYTVVDIHNSVNFECNECSLGALWCLARVIYRRDAAHFAVCNVLNTIQCNFIDL